MANINVPLPKKIPSFDMGINSGVYNRAYSMMWTELSHQQSKQADIIIRPDMADFGTFNLSNRDKLIKAGYQAAQKMLPSIRAFMTIKHIKPHK